MSAEETGSQRERELRFTVAQLREQLEEEKRARKREHSEKVRELKAAREAEQEKVRETIEELKMKHLRDKAQEMTNLQERMTRDFKAQVKEINRKNEEEKQRLNKQHEKEKGSLKTQMKAIEKEVAKQMGQAQEQQQKKMTQEMFAMSSQLSDVEERLRDTAAADRTKAEVIREMKAEHQAELESLSHSSKLNSRQQLEELAVSKREVKEKEREIASNLERIRRLEADKDKLQEEVRRLRRAESWSKASVTPPSLTPSNSVRDVSSQPQQYSARERDMILKNTELGFRVQELEKKTTELEKIRSELAEQLEKARAEQKPLKEQVAKQGVRINSLNATIHDKEKMVKKVTEEKENIKKANLDLTQEQTQLKRRLSQQMTQTHTQRMEHQRAIAKYTDLQKLHRKLQAKVRELDQKLHCNSQLLSPPSSSPVTILGGVASPWLESCSPSVSMSSLTSVSEEGDSEQVTAKYREMKGEFVKVKENYKRLKIIHEKLEQKYRLAEQEKLAMESEISQLRASPLDERESPYDVARSSLMLSDKQSLIDTLQCRVKELESFIVEQDKLVRTEREQHERDVSSLAEERDQLQEKLQGVGWEREAGEGEEEGKSPFAAGRAGDDSGSGRERSRELLEHLEEMNKMASASAKEAREKTKEMDEHYSEMDKTLEGLASLETPPGQEEEEDEIEGEGEEMEGVGRVSVLSRARQSVRECMELLQKGQDVSPVMGRLAELLGADQPPSLLEDTNLALFTAAAAASNPPVPVDTSTPSTQSSLLAEIGRLKDLLLVKEAVAEQAQEKVAGLQELMEELERRVEEGKRERESLTAKWEQEMTALSSQLSQKESQLKRVRRAIPQGVNEHMHQQLGHQVLHNIQQCKSSVSGMAGSESLLAQLEELETSLNTLLHTIFPGMFQQPTGHPPPPPLLPQLPPPSPNELRSPPEETTPPNLATPTVESRPKAPEANVSSHLPAAAAAAAPAMSAETLSGSADPLTTSSAPSSRHSTPQPNDETVVTPLSSLSGSPTNSPPQSPTRERPRAPSPPMPGHPVEEVMVMREVECEEISIPLSALFEATPTDSNHHKPSKSPVHSLPDSESQSTLGSVTEEDIDQLVTQSEDGLSHSPMPRPVETAHESTEEPREKQARPENIAKMDDQLANGPSHFPIPDFTLSGGREYTKEDLDEVDLLASYSGEYGPAAAAAVMHDQNLAGRGGQSLPSAGKHGPLPSPPGNSSTLQLSLEGKDDNASPSLHYPTPPEVPAGRQRVLAQQRAAVAATPSPLSRLSGKKRVRTQSMDQEAVREEEEENREKGSSARLDGSAGERQRVEQAERERLFVAILSYDPEAMCTTGRPDLELHFSEGAIIAVEGNVDDSGFYRGSFQGKKGLVPAGFVQEMEVEDKKQRMRLLNQTLCRPHIPTLPSSPLTPLSTSRPASGSLFSPSGSMLTQTPPRLSQTAAVHSPSPPSSVTVESTRQQNLVIVSWDPPPTSPLSPEVTGYHVFANKQLKASVTGPQTRVLLSDVSELSPVVVGVASHDRDGRQSSVTLATYHPPSQPQAQPEQYRLCIVLYDYDPEKMSPSDNPQLELKISEGNLLRCYPQDSEESEIYTMAELGESNKRGLVPTDFITEVYGPSAADPNRYEWKSPPDSCLPATMKTMLAVYDYNSRRDSPNRGMELELSFRNGDTITVYGAMDADGFYTGRVGEAFGLVPSNFLNKEDKKKPTSIQQQKSTEDSNKSRVEKWELPPNMWQQLNGEELHLAALAASHARTQSDISSGSGSGRKKAKPSESSVSGSESGNGYQSNGGAQKRRRSHGLHFKNPFSRKKSDSAL